MKLLCDLYGKTPNNFFKKCIIMSSKSKDESKPKAVYKNLKIYDKLISRLKADKRQEQKRPDSAVP